MNSVVEERTNSPNNNGLVSKGGAAAFWRILSLIAFVSGLAYLSLRFVQRDRLFDSVFANFAVPAALYVFATGVFYLLADVLMRPRDCRVGYFRIVRAALLSTGLALLAIISFPAMAKHFTAGLAILTDIHSPDGTIYKWDTRGVTTVRDNYKLEELHRKGDEVAHLAAAQAIAISEGRPSTIASLCDTSGTSDFRYDRKYWVARALRGHPPGLAIIYSLACGNAVFARVTALLLTCIITALCYWAGNKWSREQKLGLMMVALFLGIPNLIWWHAMSVSSDLPPCLFTFSAFALLATWTLTNEQKPPSSLIPSIALILAGLLLGLGTFVTYTAALAAAASVVLVLTQSSSRQKALRAVWLIAPAGIAVLVGVWYSRMIFQDGGHVLLSRLDSLVDSQQSTPFISGWQAAFIFVKRLPMDLGWPMVVLFLGALIWQLVRRDASVFTRLSQLFIAAVVLIPAATFFWPELRFAYPGWLFVCYGLGVPEIWKRTGAFEKSLLFSTLLAFSYSKFVLLRFAVPVG